jgi:fructokinase
MKSAFVVGEALIDLVSHNGKISAHVGGGPANTAKALARLGFQSIFIGGISHDEYGTLIEAELSQSCVDLSLANRLDLPTAIARAIIDESGRAQYEFELEGTATFSFASSWLPTGPVDVLHIGSVATLIEPGASELFKWAYDLDTVLIFDPNVRPSIRGDSESYRHVVESWISISDVIKLSDDDLHWLYQESEVEVVAKWLESGVSLVIVTLGADGLRAYGDGFVLSVPSASIHLVDSVGAGDTIGAVLVGGVLDNGLTGLLHQKILLDVLKRAVSAAGITCSRAGANPPWLEELDRI